MTVKVVNSIFFSLIADSYASTKDIPPIAVSAALFSAAVIPALVTADTIPAHATLCPPVANAVNVTPNTAAPVRVFPAEIADWLESYFPPRAVILECALSTRRAPIKVLSF
ncbi:hypothetical protein JT359_14715 [Candidatus Poribacteria bacterium]|nr:hypothetical protein [Candidatus Poribacteria bacterium]